MTKTTKKSSAKRKLIPAVGMLTTSAIMLSSATYAWFTMNKEVEVTGLSMSATASDALEISLGARGTTTTDSDTISNSDGITVQPADDDISWTNIETVNSYYGTVGKLMPSSSVDALNLYYAAEVNAGGRFADNFMKVGDTSKSTTPGYNGATSAKWALNASDTYSKGASSLTTSEEDADKGFYIDVPVWLRTTKLKPSGAAGDAADIYCAIKIKRNSEAAETAALDEELYKAVRVAFIPATGTDNNVITAGSQNITVFGISETTYGVDLAANAKTAVKAEGTRSAITLGDATVITPANTTLTKSSDTDTVYAKLNQTINYATTDAFGRQAFIVRVWLEGEDVNCWDGTSNQDWNIDFAFSLSAFNDTTNKPSFVTVPNPPGP